MPLYASARNVRELTNTVERVSLLLHRGSPEEEVFQSLKMNLWRTAESIPQPGREPLIRLRTRAMCSKLCGGVEETLPAPQKIWASAAAPCTAA